MNNIGTVHPMHPAGFTSIDLGESDDRALGEIPREEGMKVYVTHAVRNFLLGYNNTKPKQTLIEWLCGDDNVMVLLPDPHDEFGTELAELLGITLFTIQMEKMRAMVEDVIRSIGRSNRINLESVEVGFIVPEATALTFSPAA